jgi:hypothetical protein
MLHTRASGRDGACTLTAPVRVEKGDEGMCFACKTEAPAEHPLNEGISDTPGSSVLPLIALGGRHAEGYVPLWLPL